MIYFDQATQQYRPHTLKAKYISYGEKEEQFTSDRRYWQKLVGSWGHLNNLTFADVALTDEQQARLAEINAHPLLDDLHQSEAAEYVEFGAIQPDCAAPFLVDKIADCVDATYQRNGALLIEQVTVAIQDMLDAEAQNFRYDNIHTATGWAGEFGDAAELRAWGAACWKKAGEIEDAVIAGNGELPTVDEVMAQMPEWMVGPAL